MCTCPITHRYWLFDITKLMSNNRSCVCSGVFLSCARATSWLPARRMPHFALQCCPWHIQCQLSFQTAKAYMKGQLVSVLNTRIKWHKCTQNHWHKDAYSHTSGGLGFCLWAFHRLGLAWVWVLLAFSYMGSCGLQLHHISVQFFFVFILVVCSTEEF